MLLKALWEWLLLYNWEKSHVNLEKKDFTCLSVFCLAKRWRTQSYVLEDTSMLCSKYWAMSSTQHKHSKLKLCSGAFLDEVIDLTNCRTIPDLVWFNLPLAFCIFICTYRNPLKGKCHSLVILTVAVQRYKFCHVFFSEPREGVFLRHSVMRGR